ncbi:16S rRNA (uracil(1498)-N(3))-methyltransferase [Halopseudomonas pachastrellae]|uniref:Ribosomal RNA small subunit methyltransferase E n=1 Tax=Halopseudomonas pachastrellae TaxID=254161 RepID=A0A1S8DDA0_9GAMM|nr:16S rRNA (uracil(1498)-N(3))-methyltransferase [Halopseudomonas pachastrellae]ONM43408.1 16S rRNA (uracil(1498)-N(3))-methyltransferase [Halopseudomonas pachastrellae]SFM75557.1 16S rRNA (uracil1498-N3)-methyltransferase [Halopseudomonas pachastrellae]
MRVSRFYLDRPLSAGEVILDGDVAHYIGRVLRLAPGAPVQIFNGSGQEWPGEVSAVSKRDVTITLQQPVAGTPESPLHTHLGQALSRGERMDWAIQKAVELGVSEITPLFTERCEVKLQGERADKRQAHWQQIAVSACEQCGRSSVPVIHPPMALHDWLSALQVDVRLVLHHRTEQDLQSLPAPESAALLIGPEGGLSAGEIAQAEQAGFHAARFGPRVLRTETAPVVALTMLQHLWGDV